MQPFDLNGLLLQVASTAENGVVGSDTRLRFFQVVSMVIGEYHGGAIDRGCLHGVINDSVLRFSYTQLEKSGEMHAGESICDVLRKPDGGIRIVEHFQWRSREG